LSSPTCFSRKAAAALIEQLLSFLGTATIHGFELCALHFIVVVEEILDLIYEARAQIIQRPYMFMSVRMDCHREDAVIPNPMLALLSGRRRGHAAQRVGGRQRRCHQKEMFDYEMFL
jgi:hypothetical protein